MRGDWRKLCWYRKSIAANPMGASFIEPLLRGHLFHMGGPPIIYRDILTVRVRERFNVILIPSMDVVVASTKACPSE